MKVEGFVASLRNAETIDDLFAILKKKGAPVVEFDGMKKLVIVEGDFEGEKFWTEINGAKANLALGDAMLNAASVPFKCKRDFTGGNLILLDFDSIESNEFLIAYVSEKSGVYFHVKAEEVKEITKEEYDELKDRMPEFKAKSYSEEEMEGMGAFFG